MKITVFRKEDMHLAAYMKSHGAEIVEVTRSHFVLESDKTEQEWRLEHLNSSDRRTDLELLALKKLN